LRPPKNRLLLLFCTRVRFFADLRIPSRCSTLASCVSLFSFPFFFVKSRDGQGSTLFELLFFLCVVKIIDSLCFESCFPLHRRSFRFFPMLEGRWQLLPVFYLFFYPFISCCFFWIAVLTPSINPCALKSPSFPLCSFKRLPFWLPSNSPPPARFPLHSPFPPPDFFPRQPHNALSVFYR